MGLSDCRRLEKTPVTKEKNKREEDEEVEEEEGLFFWLLSTHSAAAASSRRTNTCRPSATPREKSILPCDNLASAVQREKTPCGRG